MLILSIETSCDETALAIVEAVETVEFKDRDTRSGLKAVSSRLRPASDGQARPDLVSRSIDALRVLAENTLSQVALHKEYGGVFPMLAKREHARTLVPLLIKTLKDAGLYKKTSRHVIESPLRQDFQEILDREPELFAQFINEVPYIDPPAFDAIAVTQGPGLEPALWVGINFAKALSLIWKVPVIPVNHMEGHLVSALLKRAQTHADLTQKNADKTEYQIREVEFPILGLLVSGGHTELVLMREWNNYEVVGETRDDAVGEAFDKVARMLSLPYPGGPEISRLALSGTPGVYPLPRPMLRSGDYHFSFAGLKTAVLYLIKNITKGSPSDTNSQGSPLMMLDDKQKADIAREFEEACIEVLVSKTLRAAKEFGAQTIVVGGGVAANTRLRETLAQKITEDIPGAKLFVPNLALATDNALMIALAGALSIDRATNDLSLLRADGNWRLDAATRP
ncbi:MAG: tRNA (adenosine(37)-N6)-threonylcarbamoyltransferase complex transferase subunit TsaD [bacterium]|nr:tRNA (adenosine(37)-N6)-threonylcarbamoyltransferase complex transferase subunit TsaD [bacterium]